MVKTKGIYQAKIYRNDTQVMKAFVSPLFQNLGAPTFSTRGPHSLNETLGLFVFIILMFGNKNKVQI